MIPVESIEEATRAALVAEELQLDGWWLRCNPQLPNRRPNSATTPPRGRIDPGVVGEVIGWYVARNRPPIIRVLSTSDPRLDEHLDARGWSEEAPTRVMASDDLEGLFGGDVRVVDGGAGVAASFIDIRTDAGMTATAAALVHRLGRGDDSGYAAAPEAGRPLAVGRAVVDDRLVGLYDIVTLPGARRRGWGSEVVRGLVAWAAARGANAAFLQVEEDNEAAIGLYEALGFTTRYTYRYRRPPV